MSRKSRRTSYLKRTDTSCRARWTVQFLLPGILAYWTYTNEPPIPSKIIGANDQPLFTGEDVLPSSLSKEWPHGVGSIFSHGAYLGPDFTADDLHRAALIANKLYGSSSKLSTKAPSPTSEQTGMTQRRGFSIIQPRKRKHSISSCLTTVNSSPHPTRETACGPRPSRIRSKSSNSPPFSAGRRGQLLPCAPISITPKRTAD